MDVSEIYKRIGQRVVDSIEEDWTKAKLQIEYIGAVESHLEYLDKDSKTKNVGLKDSFQNMRDIKELHKQTTENKKNKWNKLVFSLKQDGDFAIEFIWDQDAQDEVESFSG